MRSIVAALAFLGVVSLVSAAPAAKRAAPVTNLPDGLPFPNQEQLMAIERKAHGTVPNMPLPDEVSEGGIKSFKLIAFNELLEVAFFTQLLQNITDNVPGYEFNDEAEREYVIRALTVIHAQEEIHAISANAVLKNVGVPPILPCDYAFPVNSYDEAISLITKITDLVIGTLEDAIRCFAIGGDVALAHVIAAVIGEEGEQLGWYRMQQGKVPGEVPFLTASTLSFAFTGDQLFTVPGTCPNKDEIPLMTFDPLTILTPPGPHTQIITVSFPIDSDMKADGHLSMTYINQQNIPVTVPLDIGSVSDDMVVVDALFPYDEHFLNGFTLAAITRGDGFPNAVAVAHATVAGPGLIVVK